MEKIARVYELYQKKLKQNNALDFDDIIMLTIKLFLDNPEVLNYYQRKRVAPIPSIHTTESIPKLTSMIMGDNLPSFL